MKCLEIQFSGQRFPKRAKKIGSMMTEITSIRGKDWQRFATEVAEHIEKYTVPQYGDEGQDIITEQTAEYCIDHAKRYLARFGRGARPGNELLDLKKAAHYLQMAHDKLAKELGESGLS